MQKVGKSATKWIIKTDMQDTSSDRKHSKHTVFIRQPTRGTPASFLNKLSVSHSSAFIGKIYLLNLRAAQILDFTAMEQVN